MNTLLAFSQAGGHAKNEDAFLTLIHPDDPSILLCAVADGQGGRPGGQAAAQLACQVAMDLAITYSPKQLQRAKSWAKILADADKQVKLSPDAGFTTLVGLCITEAAVCGASSGDSAAVLLNVYDQYHELTEGQAKNPPVGSGLAHFTSFHQQLIEPWRILLMSDGVWKYASWPTVTRLLKTHQGAELLEELKDAAKSPEWLGFRDDFTVITVHSTDS